MATRVLALADGRAVFMWSMHALRQSVTVTRRDGSVQTITVPAGDVANTVQTLLAREDVADSPLANRCWRRPWRACTGVPTRAR